MDPRVQQLVRELLYEVDGRWIIEGGCATGEGATTLYIERFLILSLQSNAASLQATRSLTSSIQLFSLPNIQHVLIVKGETSVATEFGVTEGRGV